MKPWMLAALSDSPEPVIEIIYSSRTWTAPAATLISAILKGSDGTASTVMSTSRGVVQVNYRTDANVGTGNVTWSTFQNVAQAAVNDLNADGVATWADYEVDVWPDGRNRVVRETPVTVSDAIPGSVSLSSNMGSSGPITSSGSASVSWNYLGPGQAGQPATGFNKSAPGGSVGQAAVPLSFPDIPVMPGQQYYLNVPPGGSITISYYL